MIRFILAAALFAAASAPLSLPAAAQGSDYFVPNQNRQAPRPAPQRAAPPRPAAQVAPPPVPGTPDQTDQALAQIPMPPVPELPALPKGPAPPAAIIGVIGVPEVMRASAAAQQVDKVIGERREKLNDDAQKEQAAWRDMQQALANQRGSLSPDQVRGKERELQERITNAQRQFQNRNRIIQEAAQFCLNQIQASLIGVIRQVSESRGMNLVLHRAQVALNVNEFDITDQVAEQLNKVLPSVTIPADGVSPMPKQSEGAAPAPAPAPTPAQAAAPAAATPPKK
jgi:Skp family chaperone for outer membrane proteins